MVRAWHLSLFFFGIATLWFFLLFEMILQDQLQYAMGFSMLGVLFSIGGLMFVSKHEIVLGWLNDKTPNMSSEDQK